jgi:hypothetical protein
MESSGDNLSMDLAFDTMLYYVPHCYQNANPNQTFAAFDMPLDTIKVPQALLNFRHFLIDALKLRSDDGWFCMDVQTLVGTYFNPVSLKIDSRSYLSILKFLIDNPRCDAFRHRFGSTYADMRGRDTTEWQDTANQYPWQHEVYDSSLLSMHELGLDSVLKYAAAGVHYEVVGPQIILDAVLSPNPAKERASLSLSVGREAYIHVDVFDLLGAKVGGVGYEGVFEPGERTTLLNLKGLPSGTYYIHISTANNEVRTIKLVKE